MAPAETDHPQVLGQPRGGWLGSVLATILIGILVLGMAALGLAVLMSGSLLGLVFIALALAMFPLVPYLLRDARGKRGWRVALDASAMHLDLPSGRALMHRLPRVRRQIPRAAIASVESRLEAWRGIAGMTNMQRAYALRLDDGETILLGEDRALGSALQGHRMKDAVTEILRWTGLSLRDRGMVEARGGLLMLAPGHAPHWDAPAVSEERAEKLWAAARRTGRLGAMAPFGVLIDRSD